MTAFDRLRPWLVLALIVAMAAAWFMLPGMRGRHAGWLSCRSAYERARTAADTARIDAETPLVVGLLVAPSPPCGELRRERGG